MEAKAIARYVRVTPRKTDQVLQLIRGKRVDQATEILDFTPKHVAKVIGKVLKSAVANAVAEVKAIAAFVTRASGGHGAVREVIETLLKARGLWPELLERYFSEPAAARAG